MKPYIVALLVVVGILGGFYGGYKVGQNNVSASTTGSTSQRTGSFNGTGGAGAAGRGGFAAVCPSPGAPSPSPGVSTVARGTITNLASGSLTIANTACDVKVEFGNTVQVYQTVPGSTSDLQDNLTVTIVGTRQADGSIKATTIQIGNGNVGGFGGGGGGRGSASPGTNGG